MRPFPCDPARSEFAGRGWWLAFPAALLVLVAIFWTTSQAAPTQGSSFAEARRGFETQLRKQIRAGDPADEPPPESKLALVSYRAPLGDNVAYISTPPDDHKRHPAVIWLTGGFSNSITAIAWTPAPPANDQSVAGFRKHGVVMMYPSLRGGNTNAGLIETFCGEIDDVLAATRFLASLEYVDPARIYLGGHSTGGTLALLVAASSKNEYRAVFAFGPVESAIVYGDEVLTFDTTNPKEQLLRAPIEWLQDIRCPTFVFEGTEPPSNLSSLRKLQARSTNQQIHFAFARGETHFSIIAPTVDRIARSIVKDQDLTTPFKLTE